VTGGNGDKIAVEFMSEGVAMAITPLRQEIDQLVRDGYRVVAETETSAQLVKPKVFSFVWALIWFLLLGFGLLIYIFYYLAKKDTTVYLSVTPDGSIQRA
jgi:uncharacterized BrkB/YihY/UPF0761 family membrane protein